MEKREQKLQLGEVEKWEERISSARGTAVSERERIEGSQAHNTTTAAEVNDCGGNGKMSFSASLPSQAAHCYDADD